MRKLLFFLFLMLPFYAYAQVSITPYVSTGYINHLQRTGLNTELGFDLELFKRLDFSINYRHAKATLDIGNDVKIKGISSNLSYIIINRNSHRLMLGTGMTFGKYTRYTDYLGLEHQYTALWFDPVKLRYDYTINDVVRIGAIFSIPGEDGDGSTIIGALLGFKF